MSELLPCPFCGEEPPIERRITRESEKLWTKVICRNPACRAISGTDYFDNEPEAIAAWNLRAPPASPTGRQLGPGKRDELPPIVSEVVPVWPSIGEIAKAGWAWRNDKERETDNADQRYFEHNWHSLPGLGEYVKAEILKRPEFARSAPPIVSEGVERDARIRELEGALEPFAEVVSGLRPDAQWDGDEPITGYFRVTDKRGEEFGYVDVTMNLAHFRRARSALSKATGEGG